jgi:hypothetical protein
MDMEGAPISVSVPPIRTTTAVVEDDELPAGEEAARSPCSMNSDCSSVASADFEGVGLGAEVEGGAVVFEDSAASAATVEAEARVAAGGGASSQSNASRSGAHLNLPPPGDGGRRRHRATVLRPHALFLVYMMMATAVRR